ncbi:flippase [Chryseobacterium fistulae]|uniref:flippase n=1 Tax=Chryseobacterium fistulae TaxID=2675058 RepID=UPI001389D972|nr:flippase [Chryseobacterium fistulae]
MQKPILDGRKYLGKIKKPVLEAESLKKNYILNVIRVVSGAAVGLITMSYVNRVLGAEAIGKVEYAYTIVNYFVLFSSLGIPMYGIREVSRSRHDKNILAKTTLELFILLAVTSIVAYLFFFGIIYNLNYFKDYKDLFLILSMIILLTNLGGEWYFQGVENQMYITVRFIAVRIVMVLVIFLYIKTKSDYPMYALSLVITTCGANIFNFAVLFNKVLKNYSGTLKELDIRKHLKPVLTIFIATVSINIYVQLDALLLGSLTSDKYVGYYVVPNKIIRLVISFITVMGSVMLPKLSFYYLTDRDNYYKYLKKGFNLLLVVSIPLSIIFWGYAYDIISILGGKQYEESVLTLQILSPLCTIVGVAYCMGFLVLYPQNKENIYSFAVVISAVFSVGLNLFIIKYFKHNGVAAVSVLSEFLGILIMYLYLLKKKESSLFIDNRNLFKIITASLCMLLGVILLNVLMHGGLIWFSIKIFLAFSMYCIVLLLTKEEESLNLISYVRNYLQRFLQ